MNFMEPEITENISWWEIETTDGTYFVEWIDCPDPHGLKDFIPSFCNSWEYKQIKGYGARFNASGYLDCTDWQVFDTLKEAEKYIQEQLEESLNIEVFQHSPYKIMSVKGTNYILSCGISDKIDYYIYEDDIIIVSHSSISGLYTGLQRININDSETEKITYGSDSIEAVPVVDEWSFCIQGDDLIEDRELADKELIDKYSILLWQ